MNRILETRVVDTGGVATAILIQKDASEVYWISVSAQALATQGLIQMYDGFDAGGKLVWQIEPGYTRQHCFCPAIDCKQGIFVNADANIASYTIAWRPKTRPLNVT